MIIARYITKSMIKAFCSILSIVLFIFLSNKFIFFLAQASKGKMSVGLIGKLLLLYLAEYMVILAPLSAYIAIILTFSRMYSDSEMVVLKTSGFGLSQIIKVTLKFAFCIAMLIIALTFYIVPKTAEEKEHVLQEARNIGALSAIIPGRFVDLYDGKIVFYVESKDERANIFKKVFIAEREAEESIQMVAFADRAIITNDKSDVALTLYDGARYQGIIGTQEFNLVTFKEHGRKIALKEEDINADLAKNKPIGELLQSKALSDKAELEWRLSLPVAVMILALLAIPLAQVAPREGKFAKIAFALICYMAYFNLLLISKKLVLDGTLLPIVSIIILHLVFLLIGITALYRLK